MQLAREVIARGLSVRETEALVKRAASSPTAPPPPPPPRRTCTRAPPRIKLRLALGTDVTIHRKRKGGLVEIAFANEDELQRIYEYLTATEMTDERFVCFVRFFSLGSDR